MACVSTGRRVSCATNCRTRFLFSSMEQMNANGGALSPAGAFVFYSRPRCSLTCTQERMTFWSLVILCFGAAIAFAVQGYWLVLPFAGLEIGLLAWALESLASERIIMKS